MSENLLSSTALISLTLVLALGLTLWIRGVLVKRALLDHPNERSSHTMPVPRGGGWALLIILIPGMLLTAKLQHNLANDMGIIAGVLILACVSWLDDRKGVSALKRLSLHIFAACLGSLTFTSADTLFGGGLPFWLDRTLMIVGWAWFMNLYNFMDGIDGITGTETITIATGTCLVMTAISIDDPFLSILTLVLTGACLGFLALNWYPAKIFLGDVGSVPLGFLTGFLLISLAVKGYLIPALILPLYYLADSGITIITRALHGEKIWQAHRQHFYQRATQAVGRHDIVVCWIIISNLGLISSALIAVTYPGLGLELAITTVAILLWKMHKTGA